MFAEPKSDKCCIRIDFKDLIGAAILHQRKEDRDEPAHKMRIAVAIEMQNRSAAGRLPAHAAGKPDLTGTPPHLVGVDAQRVIERRQSTPEFHDIAIPVLPLVEEREIVTDAFECRRRCHGLDVAHQIRKRKWSEPDAGSRPSNCGYQLRCKAAGISIQPEIPS
jgi:hypothetical protein